MGGAAARGEYEAQRHGASCGRGRYELAERNEGPHACAWRRDDPRTAEFAAVRCVPEADAHGMRRRTDRMGLLGGFRRRVRRRLLRMARGRRPGRNRRAHVLAAAAPPDRRKARGLAARRRDAVREGSPRKSARRHDREQPVHRPAPQMASVPRTLAGADRAGDRPGRRHPVAEGLGLLSDGRKRARQPSLLPRRSPRTTRRTAASTRPATSPTSRTTPSPGRCGMPTP